MCRVCFAGSVDVGGRFVVDCSCVQKLGNDVKCVCTKFQVRRVCTWGYGSLCVHESWTRVWMPPPAPAAGISCNLHVVISMPCPMSCDLLWEVTLIIDVHVCGNQVWYLEIEPLKYKSVLTVTNHSTVNACEHVHDAWSQQPALVIYILHCSSADIQYRIPRPVRSAGVGSH